MKRLFSTYFWEELYYDIKWGLWALRKYFSIVWKMRDWDYAHILMMMKFQLELLSDRMEWRGIEVECDRMKKVREMKRAIKLIDNHLEDSFAERCGYKFDYDWEFVECEDNPELYEIKTNEPEWLKHNNQIALKKGHELQKKEWDELWDIIKESGEYKHGMQSWWD